MTRFVWDVLQLSPNSVCLNWSPCDSKSAAGFCRTFAPSSAAPLERQRNRPALISFAAMAEEEKDKETWCDSAAKRLLVQDIINQEVKKDDDWEGALWLRPERAAAARRLFKGRLERLLASACDAKQKAKHAAAALKAQLQDL